MALVMIAVWSVVAILAVKRPNERREYATRRHQSSTLFGQESVIWSGQRMAIDMKSEATAPIWEPTPGKLVFERTMFHACTAVS